MNRRLKTNPLQWSVFLDFAENHPEIITKKFNSVFGKKKYNELWNEIVTTLNSMGYLEKTTEKWQKAVTDWKSKVRAKAADLNEGLTQTGGGGPLPPLNENEKRLLAIIGWSSVTGTEIAELGFNISTTTKTRQTEVTDSKTPSASRTRSISPIITTLSNVDENIFETNFVDSFTSIEQVNVSPPPLVPIDKKRKSEDVTAPTPNVDIKTPKRKKVYRTRQIQHDSSNSLREMHIETVNILKNINENLSRMATTQEQICNLLKEKFSN